MRKLSCLFKVPQILSPLIRDGYKAGLCLWAYAASRLTGTLKSTGLVLEPVGCTRLDGKSTSDSGDDCGKELQNLGHVIPINFDHIQELN